MDNKQLHFCGGLPRAGSTVLMNVLQQNPRIFTTGTCPVPNIIGRAIFEVRGDGSFMAMDIDKTDLALHGFITQGVHGWFNALTDKPVVISKNRSWASFINIFPDGKYIAMIRDLRDVVESFDRVNAKSKILHTFDNNKHPITAMTETERYNYYFSTQNPLSSVLAYELPRLMEASEKGDRDLLIVKYENLVMDPFREVARVYDFLGEKPFKHDFENIGQSELYEHDSVYFRERTTHKVSPSLLTKKKEPRINSKKFNDSIVEKNRPFYEIFYPEVLK
jgi:sulfotransferase